MWTYTAGWKSALGVVSQELSTLVVWVCPCLNLFLSFLLHSFILSMFAACVCHGIYVEFRGQLAGFNSCLTPCGPGYYYSGHQIWWQTPLSIEPSHWSLFDF